MSHVTSKLRKTRAIAKSVELRRAIPETKKMVRGTLREMLDRYRMVYVKPVNGLKGIGVYRIERLFGRYRCQTGIHIQRFDSFERMYSKLAKDTKGIPYVVQKGIRLLTYRGRPFDIRVMVQRKPQGGWEATGFAARVAHPGKIVTNGSQGGMIYPVPQVLRRYTSNPKRVIDKLGHMGVAAIRCMRAAYPGIQELGADIALDRRLRPWILEVNTRPDPCPFAKLESRGMLRTIVRYAKAYGRTYRLRCTKAKRGH